MGSGDLRCRVRVLLDGPDATLSELLALAYLLTRVLVLLHARRVNRRATPPFGRTKSFRQSPHSSRLFFRAGFSRVTAPSWPGRPEGQLRACAGPSQTRRARVDPRNTAAGTRRAPLPVVHARSEAFGSHACAAGWGRLSRAAFPRVPLRLNAPGWSRRRHWRPTGGGRRPVPRPMGPLRRPAGEVPRAKHFPSCTLRRQFAP